MRPTAIGVAILHLLCVTGCFESGTTECASGLVCPPDTVCNDEHGICILPVQAEVCRDATELEPCTFPGASPDYRCRFGVCVEPYCGDGERDMEDGEECDDGNGASHDGCAAECRVELPGWSELAPTVSPPPRHSAVMVYDSGRDRIVLYGGIQDLELPQTWEHDGQDWTPVVTEHLPPWRFEHTLVYDRHRRRVVLFGGQEETFTMKGDTWEYDGQDWIERHPEVSPSARVGHRMVYDTLRQRVVLFGGGDGETFLGDTWEYDGQDWIERQLDVSPSARNSHCLAWDELRGRVVLFGGWDLIPVNDTWEYDGVSWVETSPPGSPVGRIGARMVYHPGLQRMVLFGGWYGDNFGDTWEYDGQRWEEIVLPGAPRARLDFGLAYHAGQKRIVLYGGHWSDGENLHYLVDTWAYSYDVPPPFCGDGIRLDEACDGSDFGDLTCEGLGFGGGQLSCDASCIIDFSSCIE